MQVVRNSYVARLAAIGFAVQRESHRKLAGAQPLIGAAGFYSYRLLKRPFSKSTLGGTNPTADIDRGWSGYWAPLATSSDDDQSLCFHDEGHCMWTEVNFGKWKDKGKTLPQVLVADPDWFFWALEQGAFKGGLATQATTLARRAHSIKLPAALAKTHVVQHWISHDGKYARFDLIEKTRGRHHGSSREERRPTLDMEFPRRIQQYDKLGCKYLITSFRHYWFGGKAFTKAKVEAFFDDTENFDNP